MNLTHAAPPGQPGRVDIAHFSPDPRLELFTEMISAHDRRNWRAFRIAHKKLRAMGYSVHLLGLAGERAVQS